MFKFVITTLIVMNSSLCFLPMMNRMYGDMWSSPIGAFNYMASTPMWQWNEVKNQEISKKEERRSKDDDLLIGGEIPLLVYKKTSPRYLKKIRGDENTYRQTGQQRVQTNANNADRANKELIKRLAERADKLKQIISGLEKLVPDTKVQQNQATTANLPPRSLKQPTQIPLSVSDSDASGFTIV